MIVLVHGFTTPSHCFDGMFDALAAEAHRVITYDLWGRGWSDAPAAKQNASLFASQLAVREQVDTPSSLPQGIVLADQFALAAGAPLTLWCA